MFTLFSPATPDFLLSPFGFDNYEKIILSYLKSKILFVAISQQQNKSKQNYTFMTITTIQSITRLVDKHFKQNLFNQEQ